MDVSTRREIRGAIESNSLDEVGLVTELKKLGNYSSIQNSTFKAKLEAWIERLGSPQMNDSRAQLQQWVKGSSFNHFCAAYSDSLLVSKTYRFLESINQNNDSRTFLNSCEEFLIL
jgi:hypothetical protein